MRWRSLHPGWLVVAGIALHVVIAAARLSSVPVTDLDVGHDGYYFSALAADPFALDSETVGILGVDPAFRATRVAYPLIASPLALVFEAELALLVVHLLFVGIGVAGTVRLADRLGLAAPTGLAFALVPAVFISTVALLADGLAAAAIIWVVVSAIDDRPRATVAWAVLAVLAKEAMVLPVALVAIGRLGTWRRADALALLVVPAGIVGGWRLLLMARLGGSAATHNFALPFEGFYRAITDVWLPNGLWIDLVAGVIAMVTALAVSALLWRSWSTPLGGAALGLSAGFLVVSHVVLDLRWNSLRIAGPLFLFLLVMLLLDRRKERATPTAAAV